MSETAEQHAEAAGPPPGSPASGRGQGSLLRRAGAAFIRQREATILVVTVALLIYFSVASSTFLTASNISNLLSGYAAPIILLAIGEVLLLICGEIDLSVGFVLTFSPFLMHYLIDYYSVPVIPAIVVALLLGIVVGWVNGFLTVTLGLPSFITTLGTGFILAGFALYTSHAEAKTIPPAAAGFGNWIGTDAWSQFIWAVILVAIFHVVLTRTSWGLHTIATGDNQLGE